MRWQLIKGQFSRCCPDQYKQQRSTSRIYKGEQAIWQRRFWEHQIQDDKDLAQHMDYIHYNPVHHGLVNAPGDWAYSSFHHHVANGIYAEDWGSDRKVKFPDNVGKE
jgi:putative transposase